MSRVYSLMVDFELLQTGLKSSTGATNLVSDRITTLKLNNSLTLQRKRFFSTSFTNCESCSAIKGLGVFVSSIKSLENQAKV